jgi:predicted DNA-binding transcriptional regulator YafY
MTKFDPLGSAVAQAVAQTAGPPDTEGWVEVVIPIESVDHAAADLIRLGTDVEVLEPTELRRRIADTARQLIDLYGK